MYKHRKLKWYEKINWDAPLKNFCVWLEKTFDDYGVQISVGMFIAMIILFIIFGIPFIHQEANKTIAGFKNHIELEKALKEKDYLEKEKYLEQWEENKRQEQIKLIENEELKKKLEEERIIKEISDTKEEMKDKGLVVGSYIKITWWWEDTNHEGPISKNNSQVGQIKKVVGTCLYGTWGDTIIDCYQGSSVFTLISYKDYKEIKEKEERAKNKTTKKQFKSWGTIELTENGYKVKEK